MSENTTDMTGFDDELDDVVGAADAEVAAGNPDDDAQAARVQKLKVIGLGVGFFGLAGAGAYMTGMLDDVKVMLGLGGQQEQAGYMLEATQIPPQALAGQPAMAITEELVQGATEMAAMPPQAVVSPQPQVAQLQGAPQPSETLQLSASGAVASVMPPPPPPASTQPATFELAMVDEVPASPGKGQEPDARAVAPSGDGLEGLVAVLREDMSAMMKEIRSLSETQRDILKRLTSHDEALAMVEKAIKAQPVAAAKTPKVAAKPASKPAASTQRRKPSTVAKNLPGYRLIGVSTGRAIVSDTAGRAYMLSEGDWLANDIKVAAIDPVTGYVKTNKGVIR